MDRMGRKNRKTHIPALTKAPAEALARTPVASRQNNRDNFSPNAPHLAHWRPGMFPSCSV